MAATVFGTREWAAHSVNCCTGCSHNCRYCYARERALRYKQATAETWPQERVREHDVRKRRKRLDGTVMFPTTHDITPGNLDACLTVLGNLLAAGNRVLVVSKPHLSSVTEICERFADSAGQVLFRFTIGAFDGKMLGYWEPGAPRFDERLAALKHAHGAGFETSVSCEPLLDPARVDELIRRLRPYVTDAIWIGRMNNVRARVKPATPRDERAVAWMLDAQSDVNMQAIYDRHCNDPLIKWKESVKAIVGLDIPTVAGLDV